MDAMSPFSALGLIFAAAAGGGLLGALAGWLIGRNAPGYYITVFDAKDDNSFNPVAVGVGQGATQGMIGGLVIGVALVVLTSWREARTQQAQKLSE